MTSIIERFAVDGSVISDVLNFCSATSIRLAMRIVMAVQQIRTDAEVRDCLKAVAILFAEQARARTIILGLRVTISVGNVSARLDVGAGRISGVGEISVDACAVTVGRCMLDISVDEVTTISVRHRIALGGIFWIGVILTFARHSPTFYVVKRV